MIGTIEIKVNAARPNFPLQPMFAFQGSPSSIRVLEVPKKIGDWNITNVKVVAQYPDNTTVEKVAVRTGSVWVATFDGCEIAGKVGNGLSILADGIDEDGNEVSGYVLGKGDVFILENDTDISRLVDKIAVRYIDDIPDVPTKGDLMNSNGELKLFDGNDWIEISTEEPQEVYDTQITIQKNGTPVGTFSLNQPDPKAIDVPVPSRTSDIVNDSGFITVEAIPSNVSEFNNDAGYITSEAIPSKISAFDNDAGYITASALPTNVSELENDVGYITESAIPSNVGAFQNDVGYLTSVSWGEVQDKPDVALTSDIPSKVSELDNDEGFITAEALPSKVSELQNDVGYLSAVSWDIVADKPAIPSKTSDLTNDSGFITESAIPSNVSAFNNDAGYITASALPSKVSELENDSGFITLAQVPPVPSNLSEYNNDVGFITASAIPSNVGAFTNDVGYLTTSSQAFVDKRDKTDMNAVVGTTYASWNLSELHSTTYSPALELKWGTYNVFGQEQECWLVDDEYRQLCFFLMPDLTMLFWGVKNQDGSYIAGYGETITLSSDELSIATINGVDEITCTRTSKDGTPEISTIATLKDLSEYEGAQGKRDWWDNTYPASVDDSGKYTINNFSVMVGSNSYVLDQFSKSGSTSTWKTTGGDYPSITTTDGLNFALNTDSSTYSNFSIGQLKPGPATGTIGGNNYTALANFMLTTFALKDYVDAQASSIPSATSDLVNDSGFITASAIPSNVGAFTNDVGYITASAIPSSYSAISDANGNVITASGAVTWQVPTYAWTMNLGWDLAHDEPEEIIRMSGTKTDSVGFSKYETAKYTLTFDGTSTWTLTRFDFDGSDWQQSGTWTKTGNEGTTYLSFSGFPKQNTIIWQAISVTTQDTLATKSELPSKTSDLLNDSGFITASAIPSNVGAFTNDVGYLTASSSSFTNKRDYDDLTHPGSVYPSETHRIRQFDLNIEGGHNPSRYTLNKFSTNVPNYGSMWANDEEYWNFAVATSNGEDFTFNKYGAGGEVATFTMSDVTAGAITFTMTDEEIEYTCHLSASMYETTLALKDYVDANCATYSYVNSNLNLSGIGCSTVTMSGIYSDLTSFSYKVVVQ